ncbi:DEKNAAC102191 [Brettanomyces naardenensis]|uniref:Anaphase-promoting complex subunit 11 n=1 Tax=Brettanomyces naardenensis TaxID=13370 RepID=A0A448YK65_BRENA|nr:DEKNAAC102191 [Brettanomyces naardenensis]
MKIKLNSTYAIYSWHWDVPEDELCGICRVAFDGTCPTCKYPGDQCPIVIGECHHAFHLHCIWKWLETDTSRGLCPMCRQPFHTDKSMAVNQGIDLTAAESGMVQNRGSAANGGENTSDSTVDLASEEEDTE